MELSEQNIVSKAFSRSLDFLGINDDDAEKIIKISAKNIRKIRNGELNADANEFKMATEAIGTFILMANINGSDWKKAAEWMRSKHRILKPTPYDVMIKSGITPVNDYLTRQCNYS